MSHDQATVLFDGTCAFCQKSVSILKRLDWRRRLDCRDANDTANWPATQPPLDHGRLMEEMHVVPPGSTKAYAGFAAFRWMAARMPPTWPLVPFLYIPGVPWLGQKVYEWIAKHRYQIVPCHDGQCALPKRN